MKNIIAKAWLGDLSDVMSVYERDFSGEEEEERKNNKKKRREPTVL